MIREFREPDRDACRTLFAELVEIHRALYSDADIGADFSLAGRILVAEEHDRVVERIAGRDFQV